MGEGVSVGVVSGSEMWCSYWGTGGLRPGWHCTSWPVWSAGISRGRESWMWLVKLCFWSALMRLSWIIFFGRLVLLVHPKSCASVWNLCMSLLCRMLQYWCNFRAVPAQGGGHQLQYQAVQLQRLLQEEESYTWVDCFANYRNSYERRCQELVQVLGLW